jgi:carbon storage regulator CsrA
MLILTLKSEQAVTVGDNIVVKVGQINGESVKLIFTAPKEIPILRNNAQKRDRKEAHRP